METQLRQCVENIICRKKLYINLYLYDECKGEGNLPQHYVILMASPKIFYPYSVY